MKDKHFFCWFLFQVRVLQMHRISDQSNDQKSFQKKLQIKTNQQKNIKRYIDKLKKKAQNQKQVQNNDSYTKILKKWAEPEKEQQLRISTYIHYKSQLKDKIKMLEKEKWKKQLTERLIQWLIILLFIYNDFIAITIVTIQNMQYMIAQIIFYTLQKFSFFYYCKNLKWWQALLEAVEVGILTINVRDRQSKYIMIGYFFRVFLMLYCQFFVLIAQTYFEELSAYKQTLILASLVLITIIFTIAQSMKFRFFLTFFTRWLFQIALFGLLLLLLVSQKQSVVIPYLIIKVIVIVLSNFIIFRKEYQYMKNQVRYAVFANIFYICIDHGPFYEFRRKNTDKDQKIVYDEVLLYTMHVFRFNQLLQILDGILIFLIDYFVASSKNDYGKFTITSSSNLNSDDAEGELTLNYIRLISQILLAIFVISFLVNQAMFFYANRRNTHLVFCVTKTQLKRILQFLSKNKNLIYFSASLAEIDKGQFSGDQEVNEELQQLVDKTIDLSKVENINFEIKIKDINNLKLISNKGYVYEIDFVLHDFLISALAKLSEVKNTQFIYLEEDNQMTKKQKQEIQNVLNNRVIDCCQQLIIQTRPQTASQPFKNNSLLQEHLSIFNYQSQLHTL